MSDSYTYTQTETFNVTHAKHISSKVATDLLRFTRFYGDPTMEYIDKYEIELTAYLMAGYLECAIYGYMRNGKWVEALRYHVLADGTLMDDDDPGKVYPKSDVPQVFTSYILLNSRWNKLSDEERSAFEANLPINRSSGSEPVLESGYWSHSQSYSAGGRGIGRSTIIH